jgi:hypothetical protein
MVAEEIVADKVSQPKIYDMENFNLIPSNLVKLYKQQGITKEKALEVLEKSFNDNEISKEVRDQVLEKINNICLKKAS